MSTCYGTSSRKVKELGTRGGEVVDRGELREG